MLKVLPNLPDSVLGVRAIGEVTADDYETVLIPEIEDRLSRHGRVRLIYVFGEDFESFSAAAAWEDTKVGMRHLTRFERIAVVTDIDWIGRMVKGLGFMLPGEVRVFAKAGLDEAVSWISEPAAPGSLEFQLIEDKKVLVLEPRDELEAEDFERVASVVDPFIETSGGLAGVVIVAERFPGWDDFAALAAHLRFVREHHASVRRVALVTRSYFLSAVPRLTRLFIRSEVRRFDFDERDAALAWASEPG